MKGDLLGPGSPPGRDGRARQPRPAGHSSALATADQAPGGNAPVKPPSPSPPDLKKAIDALIRRDIVEATFLGVPVGGGVHRLLADRLRDVEAVLGFRSNGNRHGVTHVSGYQGPGHGLHSVGCALDVNAPTNPYLMREANEAQLDAELKGVYERIAQLMLGRPSVIPTELTRDNSSRARRDVLYARLREEAGAMTQYFDLMVDQTRLKFYLASGPGRARFQGAQDLFINGPLVPEAHLNAVTRRMQKDWVTLTDAPGPAIVPAAGGPFTPASPPSSSPPPSVDPSLFVYPPAPPFRGDRPFTKGRTPRRGYLDFTLELVTALTDAGFTWGGIGFGVGGPTFGGSGDLMHFEMSKLGHQILRDAKQAILTGESPPAPG